MTYYTYHNPQSGDSRWHKPANPASSKTPFDFSGQSTARNVRSSSASSAHRVRTEFVNGTANDVHSNAFFVDKGKRPTLTGAAAKILGGGALALIGLPLLVLPGPGLLFIGGGIALAASGLNELRSMIAS